MLLDCAQDWITFILHVSSLPMMASWQLPISAFIVIPAWTLYTRELGFSLS